MKKLSYLIIIVLISSLVLGGCTLLSNISQVPATEQSGITYLTKGAEEVPDPWPFEFPLFAGQHILVGTVYVWNDDVNLYVKYFTTGDWEMTETHLAVANFLDGIPQTKTFNPIPGQFPYSTIHNPAVTECTYEIPLTGLDTELFIAAHAAVQLPQLLSAPIAATIYSGDLLGNVLHIGEDPLNPGYPIGYTAGLYPYPYAGTPTPAVLTWTHPSWPTISGAQWISSAYYVEAPFGSNSWRLFTRDFEIPSNAVNISGALTMMTADNAEEVYFNGVLVGFDGEVYGDFTDDFEWGTLETFPGLINPQIGSNKLEVMVRNYAGTNSETGNPTGLIYKLDYEYQIVERELQTESAWAADGEVPGSLPFLGKNWATYFTYMVQHPVFIETVTVLAKGADHCTSEILGTGKKYRLDVSGTYIFAGWAGAGIADAKYSLRPNGVCNNTGSTNWISGDDLFICYGVRYLELLVNGIHQDWDPENLGPLNVPEHTYSIEYDGDGSPVCFSIPDTNYGDNSGFLTVDIYWIP